MQIEINYLSFQADLKVKTAEGKRWLYDPLRRKYLVLAPEELVRQLLIQYLIQDRGFSTNRMRSELGLKVNDLYKRCDILIYNTSVEPTILVECKAPKVNITQAAFEQIARYNLPLKVPYLIVTNGRQTYCARIDHTTETFQFIPEIPLASSFA